MEVYGAAHDSEGDKRPNRLQPTEGWVNANQQQCSGKQLCSTDDILAEQTGLREKAFRPEARCPIIQLTKNGLCLWCVGELEAQAIEKDDRCDTSDNVRRERLEFGNQASGLSFG